MITYSGTLTPVRASAFTDLSRKCHADVPTEANGAKFLGMPFGHAGVSVAVTRQREELMSLGGEGNAAQGRRSQLSVA
jgi:hypothetical protein